MDLLTSSQIPYNDPRLVAVLSGKGGGGTAAASPYVIAMQNLGIQGFPHLVNALLVTSIFSAGNTYTYCATRYAFPSPKNPTLPHTNTLKPPLTNTITSTLYGLALEGRAPKFLTRGTKNGVPIWCFLITMIFPFLSFLSVSKSSAVVLNWLINLITAGGVIDYIVMCITYLCFYYACRAQGVDRKTLPYLYVFV